MSGQDFTAWFTDYPSTHRLAGRTVEVVPRAEYELMREALLKIDAIERRDYLDHARMMLVAAITPTAEMRTEDRS